MSVNLISVKEFNEKIRMYIPFHEVSSPPRLGDVEGQAFECGCIEEQCRAPHCSAKKYRECGLSFESTGSS